MKKILCLLLSALMLFLISGCKGADTQSDTFSQKITIVNMQTQKSKTTESAKDIELIINVLGDIYKLETINEQIGDWQYKIILMVDGEVFTYMFGGKTFLDNDGLQYKVKYADETMKKLTEIYDKIDVAEVDYT